MVITPLVHGTAASDLRMHTTPHTASDRRPVRHDHLRVALGRPLQDMDDGFLSPCFPYCGFAVVFLALSCRVEHTTMSGDDLAFRKRLSSSCGTGEEAWWFVSLPTMSVVKCRGERLKKELPCGANSYERHRL